MDWTLCLLYALISMTSIRCHQFVPTPYFQYGQTDANHDRRVQTQLTSIYDHTAPDSESDTSQELSDSEETQQIREWVDQVSRLSEREDEAAQRMSERSLPLDSGRQRLQVLQRRFNQEDEGKIVNINRKSGLHSTPRRGVVADLSTSPDVVVFPGPTRRSDQQFVPNVPQECLQTGICEDLPDYPEEQVSAIIEQLGNSTVMYNVDEFDAPEIAQRIGPPDEMELCDYYTRIVTPRAAPDKDGNWRYILNRKDRPLQGIHVEICKEDNSPCSKLAHFYSGYEAHCKQKFMLRNMASLDTDGKMVEKAFRLPSCCSCVVRQVD